VHLMDRAETGSVAGEVSLALATQPDCVPSVYLFNAGEGPDDIEDDGAADSADPVASATVGLQDDGRYTYEIGPLLTGLYDAAFTCNSDDPVADELLDFELSADNPVEVVAGQQATASFDP